MLYFRTLSRRHVVRIYISSAEAATRIKPASSSLLTAFFRGKTVINTNAAFINGSIINLITELVVHFNSFITEKMKPRFVTKILNNTAKAEPNIPHFIVNG